MNRFVAGLLVLICVGCQTAPPTAKTPVSDTTPNPSNAAPKHQFTAKEMAGTYQGQAVFNAQTAQDVRDAVSKQIDSTVLKLRSDKTFLMRDPKQTVEGTWSVAQGSVVLSRKKINGMSQEAFINQLIKKGIPADKARSLSGTEGRLDIGTDGNTLLSPTPNTQIIVELVRQK